MYIQSGKRYKAGFALIAVISFMVISLVAGVALAFSSVNYRTAVIGFESSVDISYLQLSCSEEVLRTLTLNSGYTGSGAYEVNGMQCSYAISNNAQNSLIKEVTTTIDNDGYISTQQFDVNTASEPYSVNY